MTQFTLKLLALIAMLCDHCSKVLLSTGVLIPWVGVETDLWIRTIFTVVGRLAFPIFAWFVAEGCRKTVNPGKYLLRLFLFAVLSEVPFQLCFYRSYGLHLGCHNVIFTLLLGAFGILLSRRLLEKGRCGWFSVLLPTLLMMYLGWQCKTDYNAWGVGLVIVLYYLQEDRLKLMFLTCWITLFYLVWHGWNGEMLVWLSSKSDYKLLLEWIGGLVSVGLLISYDGEKGKGSKWLFYWFYPLHLILLYVLRCIVTFSVL